MIVYKKTLTVSIAICVILAVLSTIFYFWNDNEWITFIVNWCVGIACSIVVVIITTYIQFKAEKHKITIELATESLVWLTKFYELKRLLDSSDSLDEKDKSEEWKNIISKYIEGYTETTYKCFVLSSEYVSFSKKESETNKKLNYAFATVHKLCTSQEYNQNPLQLIRKLKYTLNVMQFLEDLDVFLEPKHFGYVKVNLNDLIDNNN